MDNDHRARGETTEKSRSRQGAKRGLNKTRCAAGDRVGREQAVRFRRGRRAPPPPLADAQRSVLYFGVGSSALESEQAKGLTLLIATLVSRPAAKASISGYHSAAGTLAQNQELAKQRAFTVRDALLAAGIAESRVKLDKPQQTEANVAGEDPSARRVEVKLQ